jgi:glucose dehydrogenase
VRLLTIVELVSQTMESGGVMLKVLGLIGCFLGMITGIWIIKQLSLPVWATIPLVAVIVVGGLLLFFTFLESGQKKNTPTEGNSSSGKT